MRALALALLLVLATGGFVSASERLIMKSARPVTQQKAEPAKEKVITENGKPVASQVIRFGRRYTKVFNDLSMVDADCVIDASKRFKIPVSIILSILDVEGGEVGVKASNKNGTWDIGPMQINTCHMEELAPFGITKYDLQTNGCLNVQAGTWLLRQLLNRNNGRMLDAVGKYHSYNQPYKGRYQRKIIKAYRQLKADAMKHIDRILAKSNDHFRRVLATR